MITRTISTIALATAVFALPLSGHADELIAHWKLDGPAGGTTVFDSSGNGHHASATNGTPGLGVTGIKKNASSFSTAGFWLPSNNAALSPNSFTYSFWMKASSTTNPWRTAASNRIGEDGFIFYRFNNGNNMQFWLKSNPGAGNWNSQISPNITDFNSWYHVVGSYDAATNTKKFYFHRDGDAWNPGSIQSSLTTGVGVYQHPAQTVGIGARGSAGALPWGDGDEQLLDDIQYYDFALSDQQVQFIFNNPGVSPLHTPEPSTLALAALSLLSLSFVGWRRRR